MIELYYFYTIMLGIIGCIRLYKHLKSKQKEQLQKEQLRKEQLQKEADTKLNKEEWIQKTKEWLCSQIPKEKLEQLRKEQLRKEQMQKWLFSQIPKEELEQLRKEADTKLEEQIFELDEQIFELDEQIELELEQNNLEGILQKLTEFQVNFQKEYKEKFDNLNLELIALKQIELSNKNIEYKDLKTLKKEYEYLKTLKKEYEDEHEYLKTLKKEYEYLKKLKKEDLKTLNQKYEGKYKKLEELIKEYPHEQLDNVLEDQDYKKYEKVFQNMKALNEQIEIELKQNNLEDIQKKIIESQEKDKNVFQNMKELNEQIIEQKLEEWRFIKNRLEKICGKYIELKKEQIEIELKQNNLEGILQKLIEFQDKDKKKSDNNIKLIMNKNLEKWCFIKNRLEEINEYIWKISEKFGYIQRKSKYAELNFPNKLKYAKYEIVKCEIIYEYTELKGCQLYVVKTGECDGPDKFLINLDMNTELKDCQLNVVKTGEYDGPNEFLIYL